MSRYSIEDDYITDDIMPEAPVDPQPGVPGKPVTPQDIPGNMPRMMPSDTGFITTLPKEDGGKRYICHIDFFVDGTDPYFELLKVLTEATDKDDVDINVYSYGGLVMTGCHIISAMCNTKAHVTTTAYGMCASIGAMIWACGHTRKVTDNATIMFHMPSGGSWGKCADNEERNRHVQEYFRWFMGTVAKDILSEEEFDKVVTRRNDIFLEAETVRQRLNAISKAKLGTTTAVKPEDTVPEQQQDTTPASTQEPVNQPEQPESPVQPAVEGDHE